MSEERAVYNVSAAPCEEEQDAQTPDGNVDSVGTAAGHARHYAALLAQEEPGTPSWQFVFGQLSAASALANALRGRVIESGTGEGAGGSHV